MPEGKVVKTGKQELTPAQREVKNWIDALAIECGMEREPFDVAEIWARMLSATTWEDALSAQESSLVSSKDLVDVPLSIYDYKVAPSDEKYRKINPNALPYYYVVEANNLLTGSDFMFATGAANLMIILWQARQFGHLPGQFIIKSQETDNGEMLLIKPYQATTVKSEQSESVPF